MAKRPIKEWKAGTTPTTFSDDLFAKLNEGFFLMKHSLAESDWQSPLLTTHLLLNLKCEISLAIGSKELFWDIKGKPNILIKLEDSKKSWDRLRAIHPCLIKRTAVFQAEAQMLDFCQNDLTITIPLSTYL